MLMRDVKAWQDLVCLPNIDVSRCQSSHITLVLIYNRMVRMFKTYGRCFDTDIQAMYFFDGVERFREEFLVQPTGGEHLDKKKSK